jgi:hypothetical protein
MPRIARCRQKSSPSSARRRPSPSGFAVVEAELRDAEALYRAHGLKVSAGHPGEAAHLQRQALIGAVMTVDAGKLLRAERERIGSSGRRHVSGRQGAPARAAAPPDSYRPPPGVSSL